MTRRGTRITIEVGKLILAVLEDGWAGKMMMLRQEESRRMIVMLLEMKMDRELRRRG